MILQEVKITFEDVSRGSIVYHLDSPEEIEVAKKPFTLKEGCRYKITITFKVKDEDVLGLTSETFTFRRKVRVAKDKQTLVSCSITMAMD
jgi:Rho GDP-dissociation inhibitor